MKYPRIIPREMPKNTATEQSTKVMKERILMGLVVFWCKKRLKQISAMMLEK